MGRWMKSLTLILAIFSIVVLLIYGKFYWPPQTNLSMSQGAQEEDLYGKDADTQPTIQPAIQQINGFDFDEDQSEGLTAVFTPGEVKLAGGQKLTIEDTTLTVPDNSETHIMLDLQELNLHALAHDIHRGAVSLATVTAEDGDITDIDVEEEFTVPSSRIGQTKEQIWAEEEQVKIAIIGGLPEAVDTEGTGEKDVQENWIQLLFDPALRSQGYALPNIEDVVVHNYVVPSQTAHFGMAQLGRADEGEAESEGEIPSSPLAEEDYDLAIIGFGPHAGTYQLEYMENIVRTFRQADTEVILTTHYTGQNDAESLSGDMAVLADIAATWGCAVADTWGYVTAASYQGAQAADQGMETYVQSGDSVRLTAAGHGAWAQAIRSVFNDRELNDQEQVQQDQETPEIPEETFPVTRDGEDPGETFPTHAEVSFDPLEHTGTIHSGKVTDAYKNPALRYGGKSHSDYITQLTVGQTAFFTDPDALAVDFLIDLSAEFEAEIKIGNDDLVIEYLSGGEEGLQRVGLVEGISIERYQDFPFLHETGIEVEVTSGTLNLVGAVYYKD